VARRGPSLGPYTSKLNEFFCFKERYLVGSQVLALRSASATKLSTYLVLYVPSLVP